MLEAEDASREAVLFLSAPIAFAEVGLRGRVLPKHNDAVFHETVAQLLQQLDQLSVIEELSHELAVNHVVAIRPGNEVLLCR